MDSARGIKLERTASTAEEIEEEGNRLHQKLSTSNKKEENTKEENNDDDDGSTAADAVSMKHDPLDPSQSVSNSWNSSLVPPKSPYMHFWAAKWADIVSLNKGIEMVDAAKEIRRIWDQLSEPDKQHWVRLAKDDRERYDRQLVASNSPNSQSAFERFKSKKKKRRKDPKAPKAPKTGFQCFLDSQYEEISREQPNISYNLVTKEVSRFWREMAEDAKKSWKIKAKADLPRYQAEMRAYQKTVSSSTDVSSHINSPDQEGGEDSCEPVGRLMLPADNVSESEEQVSGRKLTLPLPIPHRSAYMLFTTFQCKEIQQRSNVTDNSSVQSAAVNVQSIDTTSSNEAYRMFHLIMKEADGAWKALSSDEKQSWNELSKKDRRRYNYEVSKFREAHKDQFPDPELKIVPPVSTSMDRKRKSPTLVTSKATKKPKGTKNANKPKPYRNAFVWYQISRKADYLKEPDSVSYNDFSRKIGQEWRSMTEDDKKQWEEMAKEDRVRYNRETAEYRKGGHFTPLATPTLPSTPKSPTVMQHSTAKLSSTRDADRKGNDDINDDDGGDNPSSSAALPVEKEPTKVPDSVVDKVLKAMMQDSKVKDPSLTDTQLENDARKLYNSLTKEEKQWWRMKVAMGT